MGEPLLATLAVLRRRVGKRERWSERLGHTLPLAGILSLTLAPPCYAQAWTPARGTGSLTLTYQYMNGGDHLFSTDVIDGFESRGYVASGKRWYLGETVGHTVVSSADFGISDRLAASASVALVWARYDGNASVDLDVDDGNSHGGVQDFRLQARYAVIDRSFHLTPFLALTVPLADYPSEGHAAIGKGLVEGQFGVFLGRRLYPLLARGYAQVFASLSIPEEAGGRSLTRTAASLELGYEVFRSVSIFLTNSYSTTNGGLDWVSEDPSQPSAHSGDFSELHNQVVDARSNQLGVGAAWRVRDRTALTGSVFFTTWGENVEDATILVIGVSQGFGRSLLN